KVADGQVLAAAVAGLGVVRARRSRQEPAGPVADIDGHERGGAGGRVLAVIDGRDVRLAVQVEVGHGRGEHPVRVASQVGVEGEVRVADAARVDQHDDAVAQELGAGGGVAGGGDHQVQSG